MRRYLHYMDKWMTYPDDATGRWIGVNYSLQLTAEAENQETLAQEIRDVTARFFRDHTDELWVYLSEVLWPLLRDVSPRPWSMKSVAHNTNILTAMLNDFNKKQEKKPPLYFYSTQYRAWFNAQDGSAVKGYRLDVMSGDLVEEDHCPHYWNECKDGHCPMHHYNPKHGKGTVR